MGCSVFKDLADRERSLWFKEEFNRAVKRMKISEGMFEDGIEASIKRSLVGRQGRRGIIRGDSESGGEESSPWEGAVSCSTGGYVPRGDGDWNDGSLEEEWKVRGLLGESW